MTLVRAPGYTLEITADSKWAVLSRPGGGEWARLSLLASFATMDRRDETLGLGPAEVVGAGDKASAAGLLARIIVERRSTAWDEARVELSCHDDAVIVCHEVRGEGRLDSVGLLGGRSLGPVRTGTIYSGCELPELFSPNPEDPRLVVRPSCAPAVVGVAGDSLPGRGHWFFTPAPFFLALGGAGPEWLGLALLEGIQGCDFTELSYVPADGGFLVELSYEGHRPVNGRFLAPRLLLLPGLKTPYAGIEAQRDWLARFSLSPRQAAVARPGWWSAPMFCGWGAQCHLASLRGTRPQEQCSSANYDLFLSQLAAHGLRPSTVVIDDGWQQEYGRPGPDPERWPDLVAWVRRRHDEGQHVLLWWKAWDPEGVPAEWCITNAAGTPVAIDPGNPRAAQFLHDNISQLMESGGIDADGLKVDFTGQTPSGYGLSGAGPWGTALLHEHLRCIYSAAKQAKADALVVTHTPNPLFVDVTDMVRLNDILRLDELEPASPVVEQMTYRALVAKAACPGLLVDTDDWCMPDLEQWREYLAVKSGLGVPALYYTTHLDRTGEALEERDYEALRAQWAGAAMAGNAPKGK